MTYEIMGKMRQKTLGEVLDSLTVPGTLYEVVDPDESTIRCYACAHRCLIKPGRRGICKVRFNKDGVLHVPSGYVGSLQVDPVEKKPFFHVLPGSDVFSFGMLGCDFHCDFCQNWLTSQALRDPAALASIISKEILFQWNAGIGKKIGSPALIANAWHHRSDALSSVAVLLGVGAARIHPGWHILDAYAALLVSLLILLPINLLYWRFIGLI